MFCALSHSLATAQVYYQTPTQSDVFAAYSAIQKIISSEQGCSPDPEVKGMDRGKGKCRAATQDNTEREQQQWSGQDTDESMDVEIAEVGQHTHTLQDSSHELAVHRQRATSTRQRQTEDKSLTKGWLLTDKKQDVTLSQEERS